MSTTTLQIASMTMLTTRATSSTRTLLTNKGVVGNCGNSSKNVKNNNRDDGNVDNKVKLEQRLKKSDIFSRED